MGAGESTTRKVSFGVDEEDRVRILRGVKLSEDVLQRMRGVANIPPGHTPMPTSTSPKKDPGTPPSRGTTPSPFPQQSPKPQAKSNTKTHTSKPAANVKDEQKRYEREQAITKEESAQEAYREREAARVEMNRTLSKERQQTRQEAVKTKVMVQRLHKKDAELKALDTFYKEQLAQLEKRNVDRFKQSTEKFCDAASKTEANMRIRNTKPVCPGLQAQILNCYKENRDETLRCSDLAKEYMQCINDAKKNLMVNHG